MWAKDNKQPGFTIVELLIVIVVIAILAAITIVAYNGIQDRATYTKYNGSITQVKKALDLYYAENDKYPIVTSFQYYCANPTTFLSEIKTSSIAPASCKDVDTNYDSYAYRTNGTGSEYKLIYIRPAMSEGAKTLVPAERRDSSRWSSSSAWGYWTSGGAAL